MAAAQDQGDARHGGRGTRLEHRPLAGELRASVEVSRNGGVALARERAVAGEDEIGRERHEADPALGAGPGHEARQPRIDLLGRVGAVLAVVGAAQHGRVDDGLGARLVQQRRDGRRAVEVGRDRARAGGWREPGDGRR